MGIDKKLDLPAAVFRACVAELQEATFLDFLLLYRDGSVNNNKDVRSHNPLSTMLNGWTVGMLTIGSFLFYFLYAY